MGLADAAAGSRTSSSGWSPPRSESSRSSTLLQSKGHFENKFNGFAEDFTNKPDAYQSTIATAAKAGVAVDPSFSFKATIPMVAVFATTAIFSYWSTFVGGELRQASTMKTARNMALGGIIPLIVVAILHGDLLQDVRQRLPARRERRRPAGRDRTYRVRRSST